MLWSSHWTLNVSCAWTIGISTFCIHPKYRISFSHLFYFWGNLPWSDNNLVSFFISFWASTLLIFESQKLILCFLLFVIILFRIGYVTYHVNKQPPNLRVLKQSLFFAHFTFPPQDFRRFGPALSFLWDPCWLCRHYPERCTLLWHQFSKHLSWCSVTATHILPAKVCPVVTPMWGGEGTPILPCSRKKQNHEWS